VGPFCVSSADFSLRRVDPGPFADAGRDFAIESPTAKHKATAVPAGNCSATHVPAASRLLKQVREPIAW
jgi:hypothetical protein